MNVCVCACVCACANCANWRLREPCREFQLKRIHEIVESQLYGRVSEKIVQLFLCCSALVGVFRWRSLPSFEHSVR
uniref:Putative secreted protein n=1 Tax=Anopheles marajoara TaxID=58244 RepID=A0A2M4CCP4_9DIPT